MNRSYGLPNGDVLVEQSTLTVTWLSLDHCGRLHLSDGSTIEPRTFVLRAANGQERTFYGPPTQSALDDYLYVEGVYYVSDGALHEGVVAIGFFPDGPTCSLSSSSIRLSDLTSMDAT